MAGAGHQAGFHPHGASMLHKVLAQGLGATMWFFMFYRARQDGAKLLGAHPWEAHGHGGNHGHSEHH